MTLAFSLASQRASARVSRSAARGGQIRDHGAGQLHVLVDGLSAGLGGGGIYLAAQLAALAQVPGLRLRVLASEWLRRRLATAATVPELVPGPSLPPGRRVLWEQTRLPSLARGHDVLYMPANFALLRSPIPQLLTVQNAWYFSPAAERTIARLSRRQRLRVGVEARLCVRSIAGADRVLCVSEALRAMIERRLGSGAPDLRVIHPGTDLAQPSVHGADLPARPYVLSVAHDDAHKGWDEAIALFRSAPELPPLVLAGRVGAARSRSSVPRPDDQRVRLIGEVEDRARLAALYQGAACLLAPAHFESFGLAPAEALARGVPVAASEIPAHREICGDAAAYFPAGDLPRMEAAVRACLSSRPPSGSPPLRSWSWSQSAEALADLLWEAAADSSG